MKCEECYLQPLALTTLREVKARRSLDIRLEPWSVQPATTPAEIVTLSLLQDNSLCEQEFLRIGLSFWTGEVGGAKIPDILPTFDSHTAASVGDLEMLTEVSQSLVDCSNWSGWTPLMYGCYHGHLGLVSSLLERGCQVTSTNNRGRSGLNTNHSRRISVARILLISYFVLCSVYLTTNISMTTKMILRPVCSGAR